MILLVRASIGLESMDDLICDLDQALRARMFKGLVSPLAYQVMKKLWSVTRNIPVKMIISRKK
jgi:hypothetical protein